MESISVKQVAAALGLSSDNDAAVTNICTDSREAGEGSLFFAIKGERVDGHDYVDDVLKNGAVCAIVEHPGNYPKEKTLVVENSVKAMLQLAKWYRTTLSPKVVAITGSVGKTTTKDMIAAVTSAEYSTIKTLGNQNNEIGAPRTLMSIDSSTQVAIVEMGMSGFGEIHDLADAAKPDIGVITNIGVSHLESLGSRENILKAKCELLDCLPKGAPVFLCADNDLLCTVEREDVNIIFYGIESEKAVLRGEILDMDTDSMNVKINYRDNSFEAKIPGTGKHLLLNALAAFGVGTELGMSGKEIVSALENYTPSGMRQKMVDICGITVVEDCYNASPDSVLAAMNTLAIYPAKGRKYAVLADMLELGSATEEGHKQCGAAAAKAAQELVVYGENAKFYLQGAQGIKNCHINAFSQKYEIAEYLSKVLEKGDIVWFKASRGMRLEDAIEQLYELLQKR